MEDRYNRNILIESKMEDRYNRNILIENFGEEGQAKLRTSRALVIGAGGLGSPVLFYLAAAGVGTIGVVDDDVVNVANLQRQILHFTSDLGRRKTDSAQEKLTALNPDVRIVIYNCRFSNENAEKVINGSMEGDTVGLTKDVSCQNPGGEYDFVVDCCDNYATKLLINDVCVKMKKPYSHGAVVAMRGEVMTYIPGSACYRCVFDTLPEDGVLPAASQIGILGSVAGIVGCTQATETIKYLVGINDLITNRILIAEANTMNFFSLKAKRVSSCICRQ
ncbi:MAG: HesA/MoeB/ThiF family protein [Tannerella sp.]|jgi:adenylyltransferase/sulfurtransferase|nr:HesA/MoeB/ThiF family protein [Tannerella sp.]